MRFTSTVLRDQLQYDLDDRRITKLDNAPDTSISYLKSRVFAGQKLFATFKVEQKFDELLIGATPTPHLTSSTSGWGLLGSAGTWAFWDYRAGFRLNGNTFPAPHYATGDEVGVYIDLEQRQIGFSLNGKRILCDGYADCKLVYDPAPMLQSLMTSYDAMMAQIPLMDRELNEYDNAQIAQHRLQIDELKAFQERESWTAFVMLDKEKDAVSISSVYRGALAQRLFNALPELDWTPPKPQRFEDDDESRSHSYSDSDDGLFGDDE